MEEVELQCMVGRSWPTMAKKADVVSTATMPRESLPSPRKGVPSSGEFLSHLCL